MRPDHARAQAHFAQFDQAIEITEDSPIWHGAIHNCDVCSRPMDDERYMIDGRARATPDALWGNLCVLCAYKTSPRIGWGSGQLYRREGANWYLVAGAPPAEDLGF